MKMDMKEQHLQEIIAIYRDIHDGPPFAEKDTVNFIMVKEIVRRYKELDKPVPESLFGCHNCEMLVTYHNK